MQQAYLNTKQVCIRYGGIADRTLLRWRDSTEWENPFPNPKQQTHTNLYSLNEIVAWENKGMLGKKLPKTI